MKNAKELLSPNIFILSGKVVDLPRPKPFRAPGAPSSGSSQASTAATSQTSLGGSQSFLGGSPAPLGGCQPLVLPSSSTQSQTRSSSKMGLLEYDSHYSGYDSYVSSGLPSPTSPHPSSLLPSPSSNIHFTFPSLPYPDHAIKEEPSPWTVPSLDLPSTSLTSNDHFPSSSPMLLSPAVSNLNTPRVSLSSTRSHGSHPDLSSRLRSSHSSLHSASASPLPYSDSHCPGTFGHSVSQYSNEQGNFMELSPPNPLTSLSSLSSRLTPGCVTPPRSGFSSPLQVQIFNFISLYSFCSPEYFLLTRIFFAHQNIFAYQTIFAQVAEPSMLPYHPAPPSYEQVHLQSTLGYHQL